MARTPWALSGCLPDWRADNPRDWYLPEHRLIHGKAAVVAYDEDRIRLNATRRHAPVATERNVRLVDLLSVDDEFAVSEFDDVIAEPDNTSQQQGSRSRNLDENDVVMTGF